MIGKSTIEVHVEGASLTDEEKKNLNEKLQEYLKEEMKREDKIVEFKKDSKVKKAFKTVKEKVDDAVWEAKTNWGRLSTQNKIMVAIATTAIVTAVSKEVRLHEREMRLRNQ